MTGYYSSKSWWMNVVNRSKTNQLALTLNGAEELAKTESGRFLRSRLRWAVVRTGARPNHGANPGHRVDAESRTRGRGLLRQIENSSDPDQVQRLSNLDERIGSPMVNSCRRLSASDPQRSTRGDVAHREKSDEPRRRATVVVMSWVPITGPGGPYCKPRTPCGGNTEEFI